MKHAIARILHRIASYFEKDACRTKTELNEMLYSSTVRDSYEAAFYLTQGAKIDRVTKKMIENKWGKVGYREQWLFHLKDIPGRAMEVYAKGIAQVPVLSLKRERLRLKRYAKAL